MQQLKQSSSQFVGSSKSNLKRNLSRINSLQQQFNESQILKKNQPQCEERQESSAVLELLKIKDYEHEQWKDKYTIRDFKQNQIDKKSHKAQTNIKTHINLDKKHIQDHPWQQQIGQMFKRNSIQQLLAQKHQHLKKSSNLKNKQNPQAQSGPRDDLHILRDQKNKTFFMNRTNYWKNLRRKSNVSNLSLTQKVNKKGYFQQNNSNENHADNHQGYRAYSNLQLYRNKSPLQYPQSYQQHFQPKIVNSNDHTRLSSSHSIKLQPNKSMTVRQMLHRIQTHEKISIQRQPTQKPHPAHTSRQPFDPYIRKQRLHYKQFTPFKIEQQRRIQYSLQKLQEHIKKNPGVESHWEQLEVKYLQKPTYCSWVERNRDKIRRRKNHVPLTVKPLKLLQ